MLGGPNAPRDTAYPLAIGKIALRLAARRHGGLSFGRFLVHLRIHRPWEPGLIRGGAGRLPKRIKRPKPALRSPDAQRWMAASRSVRRLLQKITKEHAAHRGDRPYPRTGDSA